MSEQISLPKEFEQRMRASLGSQFDAFLNSLQLQPPTSIRTNPRKREIFPDAIQVPWTHFGKYLDKRPNFTLDPFFHAGVYYVQEASSMLLEQATRVLELPPDPLVLDLCGAPGGKTTHLLSTLSHESLVVSNEVIRSRANILAENVIKWGYNNVIVTNNDPKDFEELPGLFDVIVVDAPCSGEGLFRKDMHAMEEWSIRNTELCRKRQQRILHDVWKSLKSDGYLIYSTCTYNELENLENLNLLKKEHDFVSISIKLRSEWGVVEIQSGNLICYQCYPHRVKGEGFFISVLQKKESQHSLRIQTKNTFSIPNKQTYEEVRAWLRSTDSRKLIQLKDKVMALPGNWSNFVEFLASKLSLVCMGTTLASIKQNKILPMHDLSVSTDLDSTYFDVLELNQEQAIKYLRKETITPDGGDKGYALVQFEGVPLGWINRLGNRANNLYPKEWRIRMDPNYQ